VSGIAERGTAAAGLKKVATPFRNSTRSEEYGTSCFKGEVKHLSASIVYQVWFDKNVCESDGYVKRRVCILKAKIFQNK